MFATICLCVSKKEGNIQLRKIISCQLSPVCEKDCLRTIGDIIFVKEAMEIQKKRFTKNTQNILKIGFPQQHFFHISGRIKHGLVGEQ